MSKGRSHNIISSSSSGVRKNENIAPGKSNQSESAPTARKKNYERDPSHGSNYSPIPPSFVAFHKQGGNTEGGGIHGSALMAAQAAEEGHSSRRRRTFTLVALPRSYIFIFPDSLPTRNLLLFDTLPRGEDREVRA